MKVARMRRLRLVMRMDEAATPNDCLFAASWGSQTSCATTTTVAGLCDRRHGKCWELGTGKKESQGQRKMTRKYGRSQAPPRAVELMIEPGTFFARNIVVWNIHLHHLFTVYMQRMHNRKLL